MKPVGLSNEAFNRVVNVLGNLFPSSEKELIQSFVDIVSSSGYMGRCAIDLQ